MPNILDIFNSEAFSSVELTAAINRLKPQYGLLDQMGLFAEDGVSTTSVSIEELGDVLNLLETRPRGGEPTLGSHGKRKVHSIVVPHNPHQDKVLPQDVQNVRRFGSNELMRPEDLIVQKLAAMRRKHEITREYRRWKALEGTIVDADGDTLVNYFTLFGYTRKAIDMVLGTTTTKTVDKIEEGLDHIEDNAEGETISGYVAFCGPEFWGKFTHNAKVEKAFENWGGMSDLLGSDKRRGFEFGGVTWIKHIGKATYVDSAGATTTRKFIPDGDALLLPLGTTQTFVGKNAPGDMVEAVNTQGLPFYASAEIMKHGKGVELYTETNYLPIVQRPQVVVRLHSSN